jgi:predicted dehydrogenase
MGRRHVQAAQSLGLDICGICDLSADALAQTGRDHGVSPDRHFTDLRAMLARTKPGCLVVATTAPTHAEFTEAAAEAGVAHILCEKPMAVSLEQCDRMIAACRAHGAALAVNHQMRFMEQYQIPKQLAESEAFGGLRSVTVSAGNFGLSMNAVHYFETFRFLTGEAARLVTAWFSRETVPNPRGTQFEDRAGSVRLVTEQGRRFFLDCSADQGHGVSVIYGGPFGQMAVDELSGELTVAVREEQYRSLPTTRYGMPAVKAQRRIEPASVIGPTAAVLRSLLARADYPTGEDGRLAVSVLVAAYLSAEGGNKTIDLAQDDLPRARAFPWA